MPDISIVTPSYMQEPYLVEALESVRRQAGSMQVEHVVCDGGSTDGTVELLERSGARWVSEPDNGQSDALNKALGMARGDIIGWLNADDFYLQGALDTVVDYFAKHPEVQLVYGDCVFVDGDGRLTRSKAEHPYSSVLLRYYGCYIPSTATFFRRSLIDEGLLRLVESFHYVMDYELFMRMDAAGVAICYVPAYMAAFRWHEANKSLDAARRIDERNQVQDLYGVWPRSRSARSAAYLLARLGHVAAKAWSGGLRRQRQALRSRGEDMRWWAE